MGKKFEDNSIVKNKYYGKTEWDILAEVCNDLYPEHELLLEMQSGLLDIEAKNSAISSTKNIIKHLEDKIRQAYFKNEEDAEDVMRKRLIRREKLHNEIGETILFNDEQDDYTSKDFVEEDC